MYRHFLQHPFSPSSGAFMFHFVVNEFNETNLENYLTKYYFDDVEMNERTMKKFMHELKK